LEEQSQRDFMSQAAMLGNRQSAQSLVFHSRRAICHRPVTLYLPSQILPVRMKQLVEEFIQERLNNA
jgi:hypothetical protein